MSSKILKLIHFADIHLGMENYGYFNPRTGLNSRISDFLKCLDTAIDYAIENRVEAVLFAGDAYKSREPSQTTQKALLLLYFQ